MSEAAALKLYNTETREKQRFTTQVPGKVSMYTCGPTVYDYAHIGNFRTYVFEDLLRRTMEYFELDVTQVMNITDVDDKTIRGAVREGVTLGDYTGKYTKAFFEDLDTLGIQRAHAYPAATDYIPQMIKMIEDLISKGVAYAGKDGSVYFSLAQFPNYGRLSHLKLDDLQAGASERVGADEYDKENASDFVLWKGYDPERDGQIYWESPFGKGRPGWHLECSTMAIELLGETLDIHIGGVDNIFPHHENEIAQSEACTGKCFAKHWMHSEHLIVEGKKMSKSLGNFYTLRQLLERGFSGDQVRFLMLGSHYRMQLNFTFDGLEAAKRSLQRLNGFIERLKEQEEESGSDAADALLAKAQGQFDAGLLDDLNTATSFAALFDLVRDVNALIDKGELSKNQADSILAFLQRVNRVLNVLQFEAAELDIPQDVQSALEQRQAARQAKDWAKADELRDWIHAQGYVIDDTPQGAKLVKAEN